MLIAVSTDFARVPDITVVADNSSADVTTSWAPTVVLPSDGVTQSYGYANSLDFDKKAAEPLIATTNTTIGEAAKEWELAQTLNQSVEGSGNFAIAINMGWTSGATFAQFLADTVSHELGHTFGILDAYVTKPGGGYTSIEPNDIMRAGNKADGDLSFANTNVDLLRASVGDEPNGDTPLTAALALVDANFNVPDSTVGLRPIDTGPLLPEIFVTEGSQDIFANSTLDFGSVAADGLSQSTISLTVENDGLAELDLGALSLLNGNAGFHIATNGLGATTLDPGGTATLALNFDPTSLGPTTDQLSISSNSDTFPTFTLTLDGTGIPAGPKAVVTADNNDLGGVFVGSGQSQSADVVTIRDDGAAPLVISQIALTDGEDSFDLTGVPNNLANNPITLQYGQTFSFGADFHASQVGLARGVIDIVTNDPADSTMQADVIGTGMPSDMTAHWGNDYVAIETPGLPGSIPSRTISDPSGNFQFFLAPSANYHLAVFDPQTGLIANGYGVTSPSGSGTDLTADLVFNAGTAPDSNFDGLPDDVKFAVGIDPHSSRPDNLVPGIADVTAIQEGLASSSSLASQTGIVSSLALQGSAQAVVLAGSLTNPQQQTAYVATGSYGLAIVDASNFLKPTVLGQVQLSGNATDVAVDSGLGIAAVADGSGGLHLLNVSDPTNPRLIQSIAIDATTVRVFEGVAYANDGTSLDAIDLASGEELQSLALGGGDPDARHYCIRFLMRELR
jgi:hypothetical protein